MTREEIIKELQPKIYDWFNKQDIYPNDEGDYYENKEYDFDLSNGYYAWCKFHISGHAEHEDGDYLTPPSDWGEMVCECMELYVSNENGDEVLNEYNVEELETTITF